MIIHVVKPGDTVDSIAEYYGISANRLKIYNNLADTEALVIGESLIILIPEIIYTVKEGDSLAQIADSYRTTVIELLRNNPELSDKQILYPGDEIVISFREKKGHTIATNGFAYPYIDKNVLKKTLPYLTYITIYSYSVTSFGDLSNLEDEDIIGLAKAYGTAPIMMIIPGSNNTEEAMDIVNSIISDKTIEDRFIEQILLILKTKGYHGVSFHTPYIHPTYRERYRKHALRLLEHVTDAGYQVLDTFETPIIGFDYGLLAKELTGITLIVYEFGYSEGTPLGSLCTESLREIISEFTELVPPAKTSIGIPLQGYVWKLPFISGSTKGMAISYRAAIELASQNNAHIVYDAITNTASFHFYSGDEYLVRFWDVRSYNISLKFVPDFNLSGVGIWNIMTWYPQLFMCITSQYKILPLNENNQL
ncbi:germination protein [Anaerocolumna cellulosilytica]|uniref:Germination protein n=1 Tax=Anaerocolumna cellulosilytica TaxID=433286 RepID=A0A6S6QRI1_9FIRM|nr:LysM peptidoglycan-binding domain-containing protein [Anaerocolumna cellulosilytica]MBB5196691.1 spore germination protein [Anaerocolumna cellulosilytica]BCJ93953.1 germination protein [Anaerocolumna cellulosilytica]